MKKLISTILLISIISLIPLSSKRVTDFSYYEWHNYSHREKQMLIFGYLCGVAAIEDYIQLNYLKVSIDLNNFKHSGDTVDLIIKEIDSVYAIDKSTPIYKIITPYLRRS